MTIDKKIRDEHCNMIFREKQEKYQHYHLKKNDKYEYLTGEDILPSNQKQIIGQVKFTNSPLEKALEKQTKNSFMF